MSTVCSKKRNSFISKLFLSPSLCLASRFFLLLLLLFSSALACFCTDDDSLVIVDVVVVIEACRATRKQTCCPSLFLVSLEKERNRIELVCL